MAMLPVEIIFLLDFFFYEIFREAENHELKYLPFLLVKMYAGSS